MISSTGTLQKMKFSIKNFFSKCNQIRWKLRIWSHLLKKHLMGIFIFCAVWQAASFQELTKYEREFCLKRNLTSQWDGDFFCLLFSLKVSGGISIADETMRLVGSANLNPLNVSVALI